MSSPCRLAACAGLMAVLLVLGACDKRADFASCEVTCQEMWDCGLNPSDCAAECKAAGGDGTNCAVDITAQCDAGGTNCHSACVVQQHPQCDNACVIFSYQPQGQSAAIHTSAPFCSDPCDPAKYHCTSDASKACDPTGYACLSGKACDNGVYRCADTSECKTTAQPTCKDGSKCLVCQGEAAGTCLPRCADKTECVSIDCPTGSECEPFLGTVATGYCVERDLLQ